MRCVPVPPYSLSFPLRCRTDRRPPLVQFGSNQREAAKQKEDLRVLLEHFDEQQMDRYEAYRRSGLAKGNVRKVRLPFSLFLFLLRSREKADFDRG
jgi:hypothetical protein